MDSFTENVLSRARERQRLLENYNGEDLRSPDRKISLSQSNLKSQSPKKLVHNFKSNSDGKLTSNISTDFSSHKTLNIQNDNFNMEIKVSSVDDVHVEVQIEEDDGENKNEGQSGGLRHDAKNRLNRLGKLYAGGEDADISSPIHQTEGRFYTEEVSKVSEKETPKKRGLNKLADLAQHFNQFEDDLSNARKDDQGSKIRKSRKPLAPQPPVQSPQKAVKPKAPNPPQKVEENKDKKIHWDTKVLDSLESQGFTRTDSSTRLIYKYQNEKENVREQKNVPQTKLIVNSPQKPVVTSSPQKQLSRTNLIANRAAVFESSPSRASIKDPALLSVAERKALFERNKGTPLIPKAPFAMATPPVKPEPFVKNEGVKKVNTTPVIKDVSLKTGGIATKVAALFESKSTISQQQIEKNVQDQRKQEMDVLLNRFHKHPEVANEDIEYDDDSDDATETTVMIEKKPEKIVPSVPKEERRSSGNKRCSKADSPKVVAVLNDVKRIKVSPKKKEGRLYPSLTDIESVTETETDTRTPTPNANSSSENSFAESDDANTSFGRDILKAVCKNHSPHVKQIMEDSTSDLSDVLDDMDDYIDEALAYHERSNEGPTPPKQGRKSPLECSNSFHYKSFQMENPTEFKSPLKRPTPVVNRSEELPTHVIDGDNVLPLTHTVSFYRKQQSQANTPVKQISRQPLIEEVPEQLSEEREQIIAKIRELHNEVMKQEMMISQTSQALNLCNSTFEFMGSTEQVEAERVLLLATHRRQAAMHEKQRLEIEQTLRPQRTISSQLVQNGTLIISKIVLPLKQKYATALAATGGRGHHVVCLVKYDDQVVPTQLVSTIASSAKNPDLELNIPGTVTLKNVYSDFTITFEVYCLQAQEEVLPHEIKYHIKKPNAKLTPKKGKQDSRLVRPIRESPAGPQVVRSTSFALMGYVVFSKATVHKKQWSLNNTPSMSPLDGTVEMCIKCEMAASVEHRGFLTMFEDVSGFGAWHRRWCLLKGDTLSYWKYPDDEKKMAPINSLCLKDSITKQVGPVSREICARLHTFLLETERVASPHDKDSLITIRRGPKTVIRHLLSADTKEERIDWCNKLNSALSALI